MQNNVIWVSNNLHPIRIEYLSTLPGRCDARLVIPRELKPWVIEVASNFHNNDKSGFLPVLSSLYLTYYDELVLLDSERKARQVCSAFQTLWESLHEGDRNGHRD